MSRHFEFHQYVKEHRKAFQAAWFRWQSDTPSRRLPRRRPRHPDEIKLLDRLAYDSWHQAMERGDLEQPGPRRYRIRARGS